MHEEIKPIFYTDRDNKQAYRTTKRIFSHIARYSIAIVFLLSATLKTLSIDAFELNIFSYNFFSFNFTTFIVRLLIGFEFFIGILLLLRLYFRQIWLITFAALIGFTCFLVVLPFTGFDEDCQCFGNVFHIPGHYSILKNIFLLALLFICRQERNRKFRYSKIAGIGIVIICFMAPFIISPPDLLYNKLYGKNNSISLNQKDLISVFKKNNIPVDTWDKKMFCFFSTECKFCKLAAQKIAIYKNQYHIDSERIIYFFWSSEESVPPFYKETKSSKSIAYNILPIEDFMKITNGSIPFIICTENNQVVKTFQYRDLDERWVGDFLTAP